jgi:hypothetical protein
MVYPHFTSETTTTMFRQTIDPSTQSLVLTKENITLELPEHIIQEIEKEMAYKSLKNWEEFVGKMVQSLYQQPSEKFRKAFASLTSQDQTILWDALKNYLYPLKLFFEFAERFVQLTHPTIKDIALVLSRYCNKNQILTWASLAEKMGLKKAGKISSPPQFREAFKLSIPLAGPRIALWNAFCAYEGRIPLYLVITTCKEWDDYIENLIVQRKPTFIEQEAVEKDLLVVIALLVAERTKRTLVLPGEPVLMEPVSSPFRRIRFTWSSSNWINPLNCVFVEELVRCFWVIILIQLPQMTDEQQKLSGLRVWSEGDILTFEISSSLNKGHLEYLRTMLKSNLKDKLAVCTWSTGFTTECLDLLPCSKQQRPLSG